MKTVARLGLLCLTLAISATCKQKDEADTESRQPVREIGEYLTRIANTQYGLIEGNSVFFIDDQAITLAVEGCPRSFFQLKTYQPTDAHRDPTLRDEDYKSWNENVAAWNKTSYDALSHALQKSSCPYKNGDLKSAFPEFFAFDQYWSNAYDQKGFLTDEEYEEFSQEQPPLIDETEFLERIRCLGNVTVKPVTLSPKVCLIDRFEGTVKN